MTVRRAMSVMTLLVAHAAWAEETCHYTGSTSHSGQVTVQTKAATANNETTIDVAVWLSARSFGLIDWGYLYQEISTWRDGELRSVAVNHRYSVFGSIRRQQWDLFNRTADGMAAYRVQAKTLADFRSKHPGFVNHWEPATFGRPWLPDYAAAAPERRADLDLPRSAMPPGLGTPLALAFHWVRWAGQDRKTIPVFLPGFKKNARTDVQVDTVGVEANGLLHLRSAVRHPQLSETEVSTGDAWVSSDHHLVRVTFDAHGDRGTAQGELHLEGCQGDTPAR
jgi:hypothetical protein